MTEHSSGSSDVLVLAQSFSSPSQDLQKSSDSSIDKVLTLKKKEIIEPKT